MTDQIKNIFYNEFSEQEYAITWAKEFEWGAIVGWNSCEYFEKGINELTDNNPVLIDKYDNSLHFLRSLGSSPMFDRDLENYREKKGYKHVIKFPIDESNGEMTNIDKVLALMKSKEICQVEKAIEIVNQQKLFDLDRFVDLLPIRYDSLIDTIGVGVVCMEGEYIINGDFNNIHKVSEEIALFKNLINGITIMNDFVATVLSLIGMLRFKF
ncbi:hypothetical protein [Chondrinema litorale]|uniref:hypothetical protein n=1 Tax=Chondrinema litorale TaxID=2994555 RepID=UPI00254350C6|nr:hypothetical protein [Chondrinema litorale]UZR99610.1 hypothetical protein OQ292_37105 [Chondrinema litorale]